jgi:hypothetical protein
MIVLIFVFMIIIVMLGGFTAMNSKSAKKPPVPNLELLSNKPKASTPIASSELNNTPGTDELEVVEVVEVVEEEEEEEEEEVVRGKMNNLIFNLEDVDDDHVEELIVSSEFFKEKIKQ